MSTLPHSDLESKPKSRPRVGDELFISYPDLPHIANRVKVPVLILATVTAAEVRAALPEESIPADNTLESRNIQTIFLIHMRAPAGCSKEPESPLTYLMFDGAQWWDLEFQRIGVE